MMMIHIFNNFLTRLHKIDKIAGAAVRNIHTGLVIRYQYYQSCFWLVWKIHSNDEGYAMFTVCCDLKQQRDGTMRIYLGPLNSRERAHLCPRMVDYFLQSSSDKKFLHTTLFPHQITIWHWHIQLKRHRFSVMYFHFLRALSAHPPAAPRKLEKSRIIENHSTSAIFQ